MELHHKPGEASMADNSTDDAECMPILGDRGVKITAKTIAVDRP